MFVHEVIIFWPKKFSYRVFHFNKHMEERSKVLLNNFQKKQVAENCEEAREEITKQLNKAMVDDWNYQKEFKARRANEEEIREMVNAVEDNQINQDVIDMENRKSKDLERQWAMARAQERSDRAREKFEATAASDYEKRVNTVAFGK